MLPIYSDNVSQDASIDDLFDNLNFFLDEYIPVKNDDEDSQSVSFNVLKALKLLVDASSHQDVSIFLSQSESEGKLDPFECKSISDLIAKFNQDL